MNICREKTVNLAVDWCMQAVFQKLLQGPALGEVGVEFPELLDPPGLERQATVQECLL